MGLIHSFGITRSLLPSKPKFMKAIRNSVAVAIIALSNSNMIVNAEEVPIVDLEVQAPAVKKFRVIETTSDSQSYDSKKSKQIGFQPDENNDSYVNSLKAEKAKQDASNKKSKLQRSRDLCEALGRGC